MAHRTTEASGHGRLPGVAALAIAVVALALPADSIAVGYTVTIQADTTAPDDQCSLREAVSAANNNDTGPSGDCAPNGGTDIVNVPASGSHYLLAGAAGENANASGDIDVLSDLTISGAGVASTTIDATHSDRVLHVVGSHTVEI